MFRRKDIALTATRCQLIERVRLALEVLTGERVQMHQLDFEQEKYFFYVGQVSRQVLICGCNDATMDLVLPNEDGMGLYNVAEFEGDQVRIIPRGTNGRWQAGRSYLERWEEPF